MRDQAGEIDPVLIGDERESAGCEIKQRDHHKRWTLVSSSASACA
jgi:hypothetical protein